jgi:hypothetical protein
MNKTGPNFFIPFNYVTEMPEKSEVGGDSLMVATNRTKYQDPVEQIS